MAFLNDLNNMLIAETSDGDGVSRVRSMPLLLAVGGPCRLRSLPTERQLVCDPRDEALLGAPLPSPLLSAVDGPCRLRSLPAERQLVCDPGDEELLGAPLSSPLLLAVRGPCPLWVGFPLLKNLAG